ncbi:MAG: alkylation response protein AidB-like acyl-CoA dehydrogenase [Paracoccaceae bacterium]|jgi:alkylation response protein AidB-like acyl-CoA dehydrogenase
MSVPTDQDRLARIAAFAARDVADAAPAWAMGAAPDAGIHAKAAALGLMGLEVPTALGGLDWGFARKAEVCETLAAADFGFAMSVINTANVGARLARSAAPAVRDRYLPGILAGRISACTALTEPGAGSDFAAVATRAQRAEGGWRLTGEKTWIINARHAGLAMVFAQCETGEGGGGIGGFLVDLTGPEVRRHAIDAVFSQTAIGTGGFTLNGAFAPDDHVLLPPGPAFKTVMAEINGARAYVAAMCCGMLAEALAQATAYGARRRTFGQPLASHQGWRLKLAQAQTDLAAARALTAEAVRTVEAGGDAQLVAAQAKIAAVAACQRHLPVALHAMGAEGLRPEHCATRHLAAVQMAALTDGSTDMLLERVARLTGAAPAKE